MSKLILKVKKKKYFRDKIKKQNHENILEIRNVISNYQNVAKIHLGGIPMIADDMMTFIKSIIVLEQGYYFYYCYFMVCV